ncbi:hypothetical protein EFS00_10815 [Lactobacillus amylovorus]|nr:hypothetical protein [Lactobacillus amylovorus]
MAFCSPNKSCLYLSKWLAQASRPPSPRIHSGVVDWKYYFFIEVCYIFVKKVKILKEKRRTRVRFFLVIARIWLFIKKEVG